MRLPALALSALIGLAGTAVAQTPARPTVPAQTAQGAVPGQVWVNTRSKVYHCSTDRDYGHTKQGQYMTEGAAKAAGDRPSRGKACGG